MLISVHFGAGFFRKNKHGSFLAWLFLIFRSFFVDVGFFSIRFTKNNNYRKARASVEHVHYI